MSDAIDTLLNEWAAKKSFDDKRRDEFPVDYQDTFDEGVKQGRIELAREILKLRVKASE